MADAHHTAAAREPAAYGHGGAEAATAASADHGSASHVPGGHADRDGSAPLGPLDAQAWGAGILAVAVGGLVAVLLYLASYH
jgi:hypothetical protein